ncbi:type II secretion system protein [Pseudomonas putida]|uniref:type II secretion system protein n=2 Tax=Pseudomonas TaxID=286 RepID=UPI0009B92C40|nr:type II secretion system protein [Pseudomonas putida]
MRGSPGRQAGFSLLELSIVLGIMAMLAVAAVPRYMEEINRNRSRVTTENTQAILDAARAYRLSKGAWPGGASCINAISEMVSQSPAMLPPGLDVNKYNNTVSTSCTAWTFSVDQSIVEDWDGVLANNLPGTSIVNASQNRIRSTIGIPGSETANDAKLSRVAEQNVELNRMRTNLLLGNNDIKEVGRIEAVNAAISGLAEASQLRVNGVSQFNGEGTFQDGISLQKVVQENTSCPKTGAIARSSTGVILSCQSGAWGRDSLFRGHFGKYSNGACGSNNPYTGSCTCPKGSSENQVWVYNYYQVTGGNTGYSLFMCY